MPYIKKENRGQYNGYIKNITNLIRQSKKPNAHMAYVIYKLLLNVYHDADWDWMANALKVLSDVDKEYYRKILVPHADKKIKENGDVE